MSGHRISVVMSAFNEAEFIRPALESVEDWADEIVVVDCSSTDDTAAIAREYSSQVISQPNRLMLNINKNVAIDAATCEWVLLLDPDERVTPQLAREIGAVVAGEETGHEAYWIPRKNYELGRWIRSMGHYPGLQLRLFRRGQARFRCEHIHEMLDVNGSVGRLHGDMLHEPRQDLFRHVHKRNLYSEHRAAFRHGQGERFRKRNLVLRPFVQFIRAYVVRGGYRDGIPGFVVASTGAFGWFIQEAKLWQLEQTGDPQQPDAVIGELEGARGALQ
jgi:glycosyltransferase involved in cell wall biosynthesis